MTTTAPGDMPAPATTIMRHDPPTEIDPMTGWYGAITTVIIGQVVGSIIRSVDVDGAVVSETQIHISNGDHDGYVADIATTDATLLRDLATVAGILADEMDREA